MSQQPFNSDNGFSTPGNITLAGNINGSGASPAPSLNGFDSVNAVNFSATGNITANYFIGDGSLLTGISNGGANIGNLSATGNTIYAPASPYPTGFVNFDTGGGNMALGTNNTMPVQIVTDEQGNNNVWVFGTTGNLTLPTNTSAINYANGTSILSGIGGSYGNSNVATFLATYGSNTISTTGNITAGNVKTTGTTINSGVATTGTISATGNITTASKFVGDGSALTNINYSSVGNIVGPQANVTLVAGSYSYVFDNTGNLTLPTNGDLVFSANTTLSSTAGSNGNITVNPDGTGQFVVTNITPAAFGNTVSVAGNITTNSQINATGTITSYASNNATAFAVVGNGAVSNVALGFFPTGNTAAMMAIRDYSTANSVMYFDTTIGSANTGGSFQFRSSNSFTVLANVNSYGVVQPTKPAFRVYGNGVTSGLSITQNGTGILNGNNWAVDYNQGNTINSTNGYFTALVAGLYQVNLVARCANNTAPASQAVVIKNYGTGNVNQVMWEIPANASVNHFGVSTTSKLAVGDTLVLKVTQGNVTFDINDSWSVAFLG
jgi:hypothetical protein